MKKLINRPENVVSEMLDGLLHAYPGLVRVAGTNVLVRGDAEMVRDQQVALISGGGSGHEPAHAGYVGPGMLSAAVAGEVFSSPSSSAVSAAIDAVSGKPGVLLIVKSYTGDRLNFGLAAERARSEGLAVEMVVVADDIALAKTEELAGRRGIAGTVLVHKLAGAAAAEGKPLREVTRIARETAEAVASIGISLSAGSVPATGKPSFTLADTEAELGLGIHGEPGVERVTLGSADAVTDELMDRIFAEQQLPAEQEIALLINNLGATTAMELAIVARRAFGVAESRGFRVQRVLMGSLMTSLEMAGVSISVLPLNPERLRLLDAHTDAPAWPRMSATRATIREVRQVRAQKLISSSASGEPIEALRRGIEAACWSLMDAEARLTEMDRVAGDGDLGITLARGASNVLASLEELPLANAAETMTALGEKLQDVLGGSSGPLYGVLFLRAGNVLRSGEWMDAVEQACDALSNLGGAQAGDRTMLDALLPFASSLRSGFEMHGDARKALKRAANKAEGGALATAQMRARRGRSSYLGDRVLGHPDPGAMAVAIWLQAVAAVI